MIIEILFSLTLTAFANEAPAAGSATTQAPPWVELESKIGESSSKIKSKEEAIKKLIEKKQTLPENSAETKPLIEELVREHKELQKLIEDYERNKNVLQYRYPERGAQAQRKYDKKKKQSLEDMEKAYGVDASLNRSLKVMRKHYEKETTKDDSKLAPTTTTLRPPTKPIDQSEPVLIKK